MESITFIRFLRSFLFWIGSNISKAIGHEGTPLLIDNCSDSGETAKAAVSALGVGDVLVYAITDNLVKRSDRDLALVSKESYSLHR